jgi:hypothetical protein
MQTAGKSLNSFIPPAAHYNLIGPVSAVNPAAESRLQSCRTFTSTNLASLAARRRDFRSIRLSALLGRKSAEAGCSAREEIQNVPSAPQASKTQTEYK